METAPAPESLQRRPLLFYMRKYPRAMAVGFGFLLVTNILDAMWPLVLKEGIDRISAGVNLDEIGRTCLLFFCIMAGLSVTRYGWRVGFGRFHTLAAEDLRLRTFRHLTALTPGFFLKKPVGELMSVVTNDVQTFRNALGSGLMVFADGIIILVIVIPVMMSLNAWWTLQSLAFLPFVPVLIWWVMKRIHVATREQQDAFAQVTAHSQESVAGIRVVKGFGLEDLRLKQFTRENRRMEDASNTSARIDSFFLPVMEFGVTTGTVIFLFVARQDLLSGAITIGTFVAFHRYILKTVWPMTALGLGLSQLQKGFAAFERIREIFAEKADLAREGDRPLRAFESLEFRHVGFRYKGSMEWIFRGLNFHVQKGQSLGIAGPVGAGKTTLMALITRQFDPTEGEILLNGFPLQEYRLEDVRRCLTLVPQDVFLFSETVTWNVGFGLDDGFGDIEAETAARHVDIHEEIARLPEGYQSLVGEKGVNLSGGQRQRLALARGLVTKSHVLLLDDVLSAVDTKTEARIDEMLKELRRAGRTQILVAHRLSTLATCDLLLVLTEGRQEGFGPRDLMLQQNKFLQTLRMIQNQEDQHA
ncbi:MAG: ABC transporter ATP-binding protein [Bdellovibrionaceae bacterium]|nr:ABC transporter ATP-binding protein [Pseudobdellovibrionaceae bacterium]